MQNEREWTMEGRGEAVPRELNSGAAEATNSPVGSLAAFERHVDPCMNRVVSSVCKKARLVVIDLVLVFKRSWRKATQA